MRTLWVDVAPILFKIQTAVRRTVTTELARDVLLKHIALAAHHRLIVYSGDIMRAIVRRVDA